MKMECKEARKKLNDYSKGFITDAAEIKNLEEHIKKCELCRRELAMWQDVNDRQKGIEGGRVSSRLVEKVKEINKEREKDINMPPVAKRMGYMANTLKSPVAMIIGVVTCVFFGLALLLIFARKEVSPLFHVFMIISGVSMVFVVIKSYWTKKKK